MNESAKMLSLIGAGPGDPELITLKAVRVLRSARVVLYDALVNEALLEHAAPDAIIKYVGKRCSQHSRTQAEINELIVSSAYEYGHVARLKGGDPFIFGRATEEIETAARHDIPVQVIPGISSALAVPAAQMIPLTSRGTADSFWVTTGTTSGGQLSPELVLAAQSSATVVILMGMHHLFPITQLFTSYGKAYTPVMIIQQGTTPEEKVVSGHIYNITEVAREAGIGSPAIIVIGNVVDLPGHFSQLATQKLSLHDTHYETR
ncbi:uroporphyrinogen-III C-methyltransferase [Chitinophaga sp. CB10]|uniref:uroporphyrinogen-III C-methyltransferase n=1 Tax=Chitinophaga sp. CB10 TaxID=1891659 RepID=UPI0025BDC4F5|nr:uroporphyrinogen-III C-methyltransferase [Chitinophaga sp. CB10]